MATKTTNYNLTKPAYDEDADIAVINDNMDIIDAKMKEIEEASASAQITVDAELSETSTNPVQNKVISGKISELNSKILDFGNCDLLAELNEKEATQTFTLLNNKKFSDYRYITAVLYHINTNAAYAVETLPVSLFRLTGDINWGGIHISFYNGQYFDSYFRYVADNMITLCNYSEMSIKIYGTK